MPSWWGKSSSKEAKKKTGKESFIDTLHRKFRISSEGKSNSRSGGSRRHCNDTVSERGSQSRAESRSPSPSKQVARCQSFAEKPHAQPLPLPGLLPASVSRTDSGISISTKPKLEKGSKSSLYLPLPRPGCIRGRTNPTDLDGDLVAASVSSENSIDSDDPTDSRNRSPHSTDYDNGTRTAASSPSSVMLKDQSSTAVQINSREAQKPPNLLFNNHISPTSPKRRPLGSHVPNLQIPYHGAFCSAPDSSMSSPSRSPMRAFGSEQVMNSAFWAGKPYPDVSLLGSGQCSSPGSGHNSGHNSMGGDMAGQLFWQQSRGSPEYSPIPSPRMTSPGPSSRIHSGAVTPTHPRAGGAATESQTSWPDDGIQQSHRLPLPPITISNSSPFSLSNSAATSPSMPRSPGRAENPTSPGSRWKKGKLLGRGTFGHVYVVFNSESGEMRAMKEVKLISDDAKSKESAKQLGQEISLLSRLQHPNIAKYHGAEMVGDKLYIFLEYVSGGSIFKLLQDYGQFGELAIRSYTQQILSGLAYLHAKNTVHRDIKGANILVDPNGRVKLADFGMAKHITGQSCPLSFKGSPYWMAPEVIKNSNGCNLAVDIWSLGCTVLEMATTKPPWSQFEGVAAMFKIGNGRELPVIPDHLSEDGKDFVRQCLQRNPLHRPTAVQLLDHPFVKNAPPLERPLLGPEPSDPLPGVTNGVKSLKRRCGSCLSLYWCFGSHKHSKRIGNAVLVPEPVVPGAAAPAAESLNHSTSIVLPFVAPPSSPASFLQSDPPSATQSPAGLLSLTALSVNTYSPRGPASILAIGPYAYETQLVSPPIFSTFTTEPSTASSTPPPEPVQLTTPSSPEVPFAQLLTSSLDRTRRSSGTNQRFTISHCEFQPYQLYPGSPGGHLISPGSVISNSGTSSPLPDKRPILELRMGEAPKLLGYEYFTTRRWGSRLGSGSVTPDGVGLGSRLGSGSLTPDGVGPTSRDSFLLANQISEVTSFANLDNGSQNNGTVIDHRVSFELTGEDVASCPAKEPVESLETVSESLQGIAAENPIERDGISKSTEKCCEFCAGDTDDKMPEKTSGEGEEQCRRKQRSITLGSIKEFNFDNTKEEVPDKPTIGSEWWANEKVVGNESSPCNNWTFFPMLQPGVS